MDEASVLGQTALCPYCSVDSVLGFPSEFQDIDGYLRRRNMRSFGPEEDKYPGAERSELMDQTDGWPLLAFGTLVLIITAAMVLGSTRSALSTLALPVAVPAMLIGYGPALLVPATLFIVYNIFVLGFRLAKVTLFTQIVTGAIALLTGVLSTWHHLYGWNYVGTYIGFSTTAVWTTMDILLAITTYGLFWRAAKIKTPAWMIVTHIALFVWIFSYAFPWMGEML